MDNPEKLATQKTKEMSYTYPIKNVCNKELFMGQDTIYITFRILVL